MSSPCPYVEILPLLGTDTLGEATFAAIEEHAEKCPECGKALERLADRARDSSLLRTRSHRVPCIPGYAIHGMIGRGAMGVVYLATDEELGRPVALKVLPAAAHEDEDPGERRRWLREARAVASVRHPNVVTLYDYGKSDGGFYLALEYVPGGTLKQRLGANPVPPRIAVGLVETIARAVGFVHGQGLRHLDLKPSNILLDGEEVAPWDRVIPKVSDFGLALSEADDDAGPSEASLAGIRGTPAYMAPEQAAAARDLLGPATDIHALGTILYELLTGRPPFRGSTEPETLDQVRHQEPVPPRRMVPKIPRDLETIVLKCLEKSPSRRYASADALANDLRRWLDGRPIAARPVSPPERLWRACRRRPAVATLASSLLLTLGIGLLTVTQLWRRAEAARRQAEADFQTASEVLADGVDLSTGGALHTPGVVGPEQGIAVQMRTRRCLLDLAARRPDQPIFLRQLWTVEQGLSRLLMQAGRWDEARSLLEESLTHCNRFLGRNPRDRWGLRWMTLGSRTLAQVAERQGRLDQGVGFLRQSVRSGEVLIGVAPESEYINLLAECRRGLARLLMVQGQAEEARSLLIDNRRMLERAAASADDPRMAAMRLIADLDFPHLHLGSPPDRSSAPRGDGTISDRLDALARIGSVEVDRLPAPQWAEVVVQALGAAGGSGASGLDESGAGYELSTLLGIFASEQRRADQIGEARRTAERMLAVAQRLLSRYPEQAAAHLALSEAYSQISKNAWHPKDPAAIVRNLERSLEAAHRALALDPRHEFARLRVDTLQRKLRDWRPPH